MNFLDKIRQLPEEKRKILLWVVVIGLGIFLLKFYIADIKKKINTIEVEKIKQQFKFEKIETELKGEQLKEIFQAEKLKQLGEELKYERK